MTRMPDDEGSVLLLVVGLAVVLLLFVAVVVDVSAVLLAQRGLSSAVDGAAVVAAQQPDVTSVREGLAGQLVLDLAAVDDVVATYAADAQDSQPGLVLLAHVEAPGTAVVDGRRRVLLPLLGWLGVGDVVLTAQGRARSPVLP